MSNQKSAIRKWIAQKAVRRPPSMNKCLGSPAWAAPLKADCRKLITFYSHEIAISNQPSENGLQTPSMNKRLGGPTWAAPPGRPHLGGPADS